jgi:hypothetical protein
MPLKTLGPIGPRAVGERVKHIVNMLLATVKYHSQQKFCLSLSQVILLISMTINQFCFVT